MELILNTIFWTLAIYGLIEIVRNIIYLYTYTKLKSDGIYLIIAVKNQEERIEGILRAILFKILYGREEYFKNIILADWNCKKIIRRIRMSKSSELERMQRYYR